MKVLLEICESFIKLKRFTTYSLLYCLGLKKNKNKKQPKGIMVKSDREVLILFM